MQFCEKQGIQGLPIPAYNQNNAVLGVQSHGMPMRIIPNVYSPQIEHLEKNDASHLKNGNGSHNCNIVSFLYLKFNISLRWCFLNRNLTHNQDVE